MEEYFINALAILLCSYVGLNSKSKPFTRFFMGILVGLNICAILFRMAGYVPIQI